MARRPAIMADAFDTAFTFTIVNTVLVGIFIKPLFILWCISLCLARRKGDPARTGFTWLKVVYPLMVLYVRTAATTAIMALLRDRLTQLADLSHFS